MIKDKQTIKPHFIKILVSGIIDLISLFVLAYLLNLLVFSTPISAHYQEVHDQMLVIQDTYKLDTGYGEKVYLVDENEDRYQEDHKYEDEQGTYVVVDLDEITNEVKTEYSELLNGNEHYLTLLNDYQVTSVLLLSLVIGSSQVILFLLIPLVNKNKATIGRLCLGLKTINYRTKKPLEWYFGLLQVALIFLFASLIPYLIIGEMALVFSPLFILAFVIFSKDYRSLHQWISQAMTIDTKQKVEEEEVIYENK